MLTFAQNTDNMAIVNKDLIQSYIMTTAKYDFNVYEKRIIYRLVEMAQKELQGIKFANNCQKIEHGPFQLHKHYYAYRLPSQWRRR